MKKPTQTSTRIATLRHIFPWNGPGGARVARVAVLFEDLRIEIAGMALDKENPMLAECSYQYRNLYFIRRSIATLHEFVQALNHVQETPEFKRLRFDESDRKVWSRSISFLAKHQKFFADIRNDLGGHYGEQAAIKAINSLQANAVGSIEVAIYGKGGGVKLHFASEIAAMSLIFHCRGNTPKAKVQGLFRRLLVAYRYATRATDIITAYYLWPKFGKT